LFEHWVASGVQTPVHAPLAHARPVQSLAVPQVPVASQVCTPLFEHWVAPGVQVPVHAPATQAWLAHALGAPHVPSALQLCTELPEQFVCPAEQLPEQAPLLQVMPVPHGTAALQAPLGVQVSTPLSAEHLVAPGVHAPEHEPFTQA
jgi:hypothetical protein